MSASERSDPVAAGSAYPPSIQAGIPNLGPTPSGWGRARLGDLLEPVHRPVQMADDTMYQLITAKRNRAGIIARERLRGRDIRVKDQHVVREGDFIMSNRQISHGGCGVVPAALDGAIVSNEYTILKARGPIDIGFLSQFSHSAYFQQTCFHSSIGVHVEKLVFRLVDWFDWEINLPPLAEQRRIADTLAAWDRAIETADALVAAKRRRKTALARTVSESGAPRARLSDIVEINARSLGVSTPGDHRFEYFPIGDEDEDTEARGWMTFCESPSRARRLARTGDVIYSTVRPLLRRVFIAPEHPAAVYSTGYAVLGCGDAIDSAYLLHLMTTPVVERQVHARLTGSNYPALASGDLGEIEIPLPALEKQRAVSSALTVMDAEVAAFDRCAQSLRTQKRGVMQKLLTGVWRLKERVEEKAA